MENQLTILNEIERKEIIIKLKSQFGISENSLIIKNSKFIKRGKERIYFLNADISDKEIYEISSISQIESFGMYFGKEDTTQENRENLRLSIEAAQLLKNEITKNIVTLNSASQAEEWMLGRELLIPQKNWTRGVVVIKYKDDMLGCGKASAEKITNFIPKNRRLRERS